MSPCWPGPCTGCCPVAGALASPASRAWQPLARQARDSGDGAAALAAVEQMPQQDLAALLEDALDHWAAGGAEPAFHIVDDVDAAGNAEASAGLSQQLDPVYALLRMVAPTSQGPIPMIALQPESGPAGLQDLRQRTRWAPWDLTAVPDTDISWKVRVDIATRSIDQIVHVDAEGYDDVMLWSAPQPVTLPDDWWDLLDRVQYAILCGPVLEAEDGSLQQAAQAGELLAVVAAVRFW